MYIIGFELFYKFFQSSVVAFGYRLRKECPHGGYAIHLYVFYYVGLGYVSVVETDYLLCMEWFQLSYDGLCNIFYSSVIGIIIFGNMKNFSHKPVLKIIYCCLKINNLLRLLVFCGSCRKVINLFINNKKCMTYAQ